MTTEDVLAEIYLTRSGYIDIGTEAYPANVRR